MTLAIIPARGGSKGIPRKNVREIAGKPLIAWTIEAALAAQGVSRVIVSTEDEEIASIARQYGADVPFMRPAALAADDTPGVAPVLHAAEQLPDYGELLLLQPTSPLRGTAEIEALLTLAQSEDAGSVVSVTEARDHPAWMFRLSGLGRLEKLVEFGDAARRQDLSELYSLNGAMYWVRRDWLQRIDALVGPDTLGFVMDARTSVDIDTMFDWTVAEVLLRERVGSPT